MSKSRSSNVEIQNAENCDFHMFRSNIWIGTRKIIIKKKHLVYGMRLMNQSKKVILQLISYLNKKVKVTKFSSSKCGKTGISTCFGTVFRKVHKRK